MASAQITVGFHELGQSSRWETSARDRSATQFVYKFENFFHPFLGELIAKLNRDSLPGILDTKWQDELKQEFFNAFYNSTGGLVQVNSFPKEIDVSEYGPYANYNWELFFHVPLTIAVHLSKNQRFAEAQRWFHYIFDPTCNDTSIPPPQRYWKFLAFRPVEYPDLFFPVVGDWDGDGKDTAGIYRSSDG